MPPSKLREFLEEQHKAAQLFAALFEENRALARECQSRRGESDRLRANIKDIDRDNKILQAHVVRLEKQIARLKGKK